MAEGAVQGYGRAVAQQEPLQAYVIVFPSLGGDGSVQSIEGLIERTARPAEKADPVPRCDAGEASDFPPDSADDLARLKKLKQEIDPQETYHGISVPILKVFGVIRRANADKAKCDRPVTLLGEAGAGKTLLSSLIHLDSGRSRKRLPGIDPGPSDPESQSKALNDWVKRESQMSTPSKEGGFAPFYQLDTSASANDNAFHSSLWYGVGEESGLSNVTRSRPGLAGHTGTVFIDEIGESSVALHNILKVVADTTKRRFPPYFGEGPEASVEVRLITATNRNLDQDVQAGRFPHDLWDRLRTGTVIRIPHLRERKEDLFDLVHQRVAKYATSPKYKLEDGFWLSLLLYDWPGNCRQLVSEVDSALGNADSSNRRRRGNKGGKISVRREHLSTVIRRATEMGFKGICDPKLEVYRRLAEVLTEKGYTDRSKSMPLHRTMSEILGLGWSEATLSRLKKALTEVAPPQTSKRDASPKASG